MAIIVLHCLSGIVASCGLLMEVFMLSCIFFPGDSEAAQLRQPLRLLLGSIVATITFVNLVVISGICESAFFGQKNTLFYIAASQDLFMYACLISCSWLSFFYYIKIVPVRRSVLLHLKHHIYKVVKWGLLSGILLDAFIMMLFVLYELVSPDLKSRLLRNITFPIPSNATSSGEILLAGIISTIIYATFYVSMMVLTCVGTVVHLYKHMKRINGSSQLINPRLDKQWRAMRMIAVQVALYLGSLLVNLTLYTCQKVLEDPDMYLIWFTMLTNSGFSFGTGVNLMVGQAQFRQRAAFWFKFFE